MEKKSEKDFIITNEIFYSTKNNSFIVVISPKYGIQECIPVGCVSPASMVIHLGRGVVVVSVSGCGRYLSLGVCVGLFA